MKKDKRKEKIKIIKNIYMKKKINNCIPIKILSKNKKN
jgi:hypothetical protein